MFLPPLFKILNDDISVGGGIKISKVFSMGRSSPELRVTDRPVTVTYDFNVKDRYGVEIVDLDVDKVSNTSVDVRVRGYDNFVNPSVNDLQVVVVALKRDNEDPDLNLRSVINLLTSFGDPMSVLYNDNIALDARSELIVNQVNDNRSIRNKSRLFSETILRKGVHAETSGHDTFLDLTRLQKYRMFGPHFYDIITVFNDAGLTFSSMKRSVFVQGIYDVFVEPLRETGVRTGVNADDTLVLKWKSSDAVKYVTAIQIRDPEGNILVDTVAGDATEFVVALNVFGSYRGELRGYVQYENVFWSPYNYSNSIVFETSNEPRVIEFKVSNDEKYDINYEELWIQLTTLDMGSAGNTGVLVRTVTVRLFEDEDRTIPAGNAVSFESLYESQIVRNLRVATAYYMSYETNDRLNPVHSDVIDAQYSTRVDPAFVADTEGPVIVLDVVSTNPIRFDAFVSDVSFLVKVQFSLFSDLEVDQVTTYQQWTPIQITELKKEISVSQQEVFVYFKDNTNVKPFLVENSDISTFKFVLQAIDINNNQTTKTLIITRD